MPDAFEWWFNTIRDEDLEYWFNSRPYYCAECELYYQGFEVQEAYVVDYTNTIATDLVSVCPRGHDIKEGRDW